MSILTLDHFYEPPSRLFCHDYSFFNQKGERTFIKGVTDFLLYQRYLDEGVPAIKPVLEQRKALGANCVRVIGMVSSFSHWYPQDYGNRYYDALPGFLDLLSQYGLYCYFTVFADTQIVMPSKADQLNHWARVMPLLQAQPNVLIELVNEPYAHENETDDPWAFPRPWLVPASSGSYNDKYPGAKDGRPSPGPHWDFHDYHTPRSFPKNVGDQCMAINPNYLQLGQPVLSGEPDKFGRPDPNGRPRHTNPRLAGMMAGTASGSACGIFYHTNAGIMSVLFTDDNGWNEIACAKAFFRELV